MAMIKDPGNPGKYLRDEYPHNPGWVGRIIDISGVGSDILYYFWCFICDNNGLMTLKMVTNKAPMLDYSPIEDLCTQILMQIKEQFEKFRNVFPYEIIEKYGGDKQGSISWLEEQMVQQLFKGRDRLGMPEINNSLSIIWELDVDFLITNLLNNMCNYVHTSDAIINSIHEKSMDNKYENKYENKFPWKLLPIFKNGNFEPKTPEEVRAYEMYKKGILSVENPLSTSIP